jgi:hypothetical protein
MFIQNYCCQEMQKVGGLSSKTLLFDAKWIPFIVLYSISGNWAHFSYKNNVGSIDL